MEGIAGETLCCHDAGHQVASKQLKALKDWIDGSHFYRHEPGSEEPNQPLLDKAILMVSKACACLRWLRGFDIK
ncbi:hypothetical protein ASF70_07500 [Rhizobium sp. Leaf321]|nr:hypothetical protein ASF70_07500 [Rhizobium sp. Leaf321]